MNEQTGIFVTSGESLRCSHECCEGDTNVIFTRASIWALRQEIIQIHILTIMCVVYREINAIFTSIRKCGILKK